MVRLGERGLLVVAFILSTALWIAVLYPTPIWQGYIVKAPDDTSRGEKWGEHVHKHAYMYFMIDGEVKNISEQYVNRRPEIHYHDTDNVLHKHAGGLQISHALLALNTSVNKSCLHFTLDDETYCETDEKELRINVNGETLPTEQALNHLIEQGDNVVIYYGDPEAEVPREYTEKELPENLKPSYEPV